MKCLIGTSRSTLEEVLETIKDIYQDEVLVGGNLETSPRALEFMFRQGLNEPTTCR
eukprot:CAMPEP_0115040862 /NCGR_PEP_ID=MMETSP0216-20121206/45129_1 /TAXON_ID=223996 /ORGANISM="Protocruzia adherens, Strain Boccale" /LENGTH=55 /DNA_ID=CAMNT_0002422279 /DNA_START=106 /DNA_END=269 /DNA_ORIENTATION=+